MIECIKEKRNLCEAKQWMKCFIRKKKEKKKKHIISERRLASHAGRCTFFLVNLMIKISAHIKEQVMTPVDKCC